MIQYQIYQVSKLGQLNNSTTLFSIPCFKGISNDCKRMSLRKFHEFLKLGILKGLPKKTLKGEQFTHILFNVNVSCIFCHFSYTVIQFKSIYHGSHLPVVQRACSPEYGQMHLISRILIWSAKSKKIRKYILTYFLYGYSFFVLHINKYIQISC